MMHLTAVTVLSVQLELGRCDRRGLGCEEMPRVYLAGCFGC